MADEEKPGDQPTLGKKFPGEPFSTIKSAEQLAEQIKLDAKVGDPNTMPIEHYFQIKRINDPIRRNMMLAFTKVRRATLETFDSVFKTF